MYLAQDEVVICKDPGKAGLQPMNKGNEGSSRPRRPASDTTVSVTEWLRSLGLAQYASAFAENAIEWQILPKLSGDDLKEIGIVAVGDRRRLLEAISALPAAESTMPAPTLPAAAAERRQVTVMFCDLIGSTALSLRLDPEELSAVIRGYQARVASVIPRFGGFIARYVGDGILIYFGWPEAHEANAERAVRAALAVVDALAQAPVLTEPLQVRIGIATGLVVVGEPIDTDEGPQQIAIGETPNLAARLQNLAGPNGIVIDAATHRQIGGFFKFRDLGTNALKGLPNPVSAWEVLEEAAVESRFEALHAEMMTPLVGRHEELELLQRRWLRARSGEGQVVLLSGEPGIGKSRLMVELEQRIAAETHVSLRYFCAPHYQDSPLRPVIARWEHSAGFAHGDGAQEKLRKLETMLLPGETSTEDLALIADLLSVPTEGRYPKLEYSPQRKKQKTIEALNRWLAGLARTNCVLMLFEDAHWTDASTLELLETTIDQLVELPILLVVSFRPEFSAPWIGRAGVSLIALSRLDRSESAALAARVIREHALTVALLDRIVTQTDGVPLFIEELTKAILEDAVISSIPPMSAAVPATLHASLVARLDRLGPIAKEVAQVGAAIGRDFSYELVAAVVQRSAAELDQALSRVVDAGLVFQRGAISQATFSFKHALVRDAAQSTLLRAARQQLHARIAEALEAHSPELMDIRPEVLAQHCAEAGFVEKSVAYWGKAGRISVARSAMSEATAQFRKALDQLALLPNNRERQWQELEFLSAMGTALMAAKGQAAKEAGDAYTRARELWELLGSPSQFLHVPYGQSTYLMYRGELDRAMRLDQDLLHLGYQHNDSAVVMIGHYSCGRTQMYAGEFLSSRLHLEEMLALYDPLSHRSLVERGRFHLQPLSQAYLGIVLFCLGFPDQALARSSAAIVTARQQAHPPSLAVILVLDTRLHLLIGDNAVVDERAAQLVAVTTEQGFSFWRAQGAIYRGWVKVKNGDVMEGISLLRSGSAAHRATGAETVGPYFNGLLASAYEISGQIEEALAQLDDALQIIERTGERWFEAELHRHKGQLLLGRGHTKPAEDLYRKALGVANEQQAKLWELRAAASLARLLRDQGRQVEARNLLAPVYGWFTEGFNTRDLKEAKALLDELTGTFDSTATADCLADPRTS